jgi:uncharacterized metal-binding protein YceD (DUF177 family)
MAADLPDLVDYSRLGGEQAQLERVYQLADLPRLRDLLAKPEGTLKASFAFAADDSGRARVDIVFRATPQLVCQRCLRGFSFPVSGGSEVEVGRDDAPQAPDAGREFYWVEADKVSLRELAEEELLLALPIAAACSAPQSCGNAPEFAANSEVPEAPSPEAPGTGRRPFGGLQDLLKKT